MAKLPKQKQEVHRPADAVPQRPGVQARFEQQTVTFRQGPLPAADEMAAYQALLPDAAHRLFCMAEAQSKHRQDMERIALDSQVRDTRRGQYMAFGISAIALCVGGGLLATGHDIGGYAALLGAIAVLVAPFIAKGRKKKPPTPPADKAVAPTS